MATDGEIPQLACSGRAGLESRPCHSLAAPLGAQMKPALPVAAFFGIALALPAAADEKAAKPDPAKAAQIASTVCAACHGPDGNSPIPQNPNLAGQVPQ